ncbi:SDR family NAD(P)-dependent oxidoreductase [Dactylosporangium sucinum]|uniref:SDR family NAD(P)-dependent oxidoreductase n=1 Tax=Dactylosporangium sucinum TaxID=1424081 RepID=UPI00167C4B34|nr:SDR family NAD(P)-dependent oxidoreductase [Dactylosporangium sucinum]
MRALVIGNSDGIGLAFTRRLLDEGWTVCGLSRSDSPLTHASYSHVTADVVTAAIPADPVDLCVYAAGVGELLDLDDLAAQTRAIEVNLLGAARTVEAVVPAMAAAGRGHLIGLSSLADLVISPDAPGYAASKAGLTAYLLGLRAALRPRGVAVTAVRFGFVDTKMAKGASKPLMIPVDEAVEVLMRCVRRRPAVMSYPRRVSAAARVIRAVTRATLR